MQLIRAVSLSYSKAFASSFVGRVLSWILVRYCDIQARCCFCENEISECGDFYLVRLELYKKY
jgi:hypothetical protein